MDTQNKHWKIIALFSLCLFLSSCGGSGGGGGSSSSNNNNNITIPPQNITMDFKQSDTIIGVIDSSFSYLDEFKDSSGKYRIFIDSSFPTDPEEKKSDSYTHGELVSLLIGGNKTGVTDGVKIYAIPSFLAYSDQIKVQGSMYQKMYQAGVRIFSQSFGSPTNDLTFEKFPASSSLVNFYVNRSATDSLFIFAAGNNGKNNPAAEAFFPKLYPRAEKGWISVVGINPKTGLIDPESNRAGDAKNWTIAANYAVTVHNVTAYGTSFAAPVVAGAAGAIQIKYPWMSRDLIKQSLLTTATDLGDPGVDSTYGWGYLNLGKALK
ncbi:S8 family serine peptidase, partial [Fusobacterium sp.]|uniref:S8 family serine peptidase n=1 Tax=Fusobacterium sp. TaxID=68766 RepID=UPI0028FE1F0A